MFKAVVGFGFAALIAGSVAHAGTQDLFGAGVTTAPANGDVTTSGSPGVATISPVTTTVSEASKDTFIRRFWTDDTTMDWAFQLDLSPYSGGGGSTLNDDECIEDYPGSSTPFRATVRQLGGSYFELLDGGSRLQVLESTRVVNLPALLEGATVIEFVSRGYDSGTEDYTVHLTPAGGGPDVLVTVPMVGHGAAPGVLPTTASVSGALPSTPVSYTSFSTTTGSPRSSCPSTWYGVVVRLTVPASMLASGISAVRVESSDTGRLTGVYALNVIVSSDDYDAAVQDQNSSPGNPSAGKWRGTVRSAVDADGTGAAENPIAWWYKIGYNVTWPSNLAGLPADTYSDVLLTGWCDDDGNPVDGDPLFVNLSLRDVQAASGAGSFLLGSTVGGQDTDLCRGQVLVVESDVVASFGVSPSVRLTGYYDVDKDNDGFTVEGIFQPPTPLGAGSRYVLENAGTDFVSANSARIDCDDTTSLSTVAFTVYTDNDGDGYGTTSAGTSCSLGANQASVGGDCFDGVGGNVIRPGVVTAETPAAGIDYNCDNLITCYADVDNDGDGPTGGAASSVSIAGLGFTVNLSNNLCTSRANSATNTDDCNDASSQFTKNNLTGTRGAETPADAKDYDCSGAVTCYRDLDNDDHGTAVTDTFAVASPGATLSCASTANASALNDDCRDGDATIYYGATEAALTGQTAPGIDSNCDNFVSCYADGDADGDGTNARTVKSIDLRLSPISTTAGAAISCTRSAANNPATVGATSEVATDCNDASNQFSTLVTATRSDETTAIGFDYNCDGNASCWTDADNDDYGSDVKRTVSTGGASSVNCDQTAQSATLGGPGANLDCNDGSALFKPFLVGETVGAGNDTNCDEQVTCYQDLDADQFGSATTVTLSLTAGQTVVSCVRTAAQNGSTSTPPNVGTASGSTDCRDEGANANLFNTSASEVGIFGEDRNCSGSVTCFPDVDGDGEGAYASQSVSVVAGWNSGCTMSGFRGSGTDCNDTAGTGAAFKASATEAIGSSVDLNCDGDLTCYVDSDHDSYGSATTILRDNVVSPGGTGTCDDPVNGFGNEGTDCDDAVATTFPTASEPTGTQVDRNCNAQVVCYADADGDSAGSYVATVTEAVTAGGTATCVSFGGATTSTDCKDTGPSAALFFEGATEAIGTPSDFNCDQTIRCYLDTDKDGQGTSTGAFNNIALGAKGDSAACLATDSRSTNNQDCRDADATIFLGATEAVGTGVDNNCDGTVACFRDDDGDDYGTTTTVNNPFVISAGATISCAAIGAANDDDCLDCLNPGVGGACGDTVANRAQAAAINPDPVRTEILVNDFDEDCDGRIACFPDDDFDGQGDEATNVADPNTWVLTAAKAVPDGRGQCVTVQGQSDNNLDCHDGFAAFYQGAQHLVSTTTYQRVAAYTGGPVPAGQVVMSEIPGDAYDNDCDEQVLCYKNSDGDQVGVQATLPGTATDFKIWNGTRQTNPAITGSFTRNLGEAYVCRPAALEAPLVLSAATGLPSWDCNDNESSIYPGATEVDGVGIDNNCDSQVACFIDVDRDGFGGSTQNTPSPSAGYRSTVDGPQICVPANGFAANGSDCHDNNAAARPGATEIVGHTPAAGSVMFVPGQGTVVVGTGVGEFDLCGEGRTLCYNAAFDEDCSGTYTCYTDRDGDSFGVGQVNVSVPAGAGRNEVYTCDTPTLPAAQRTARRGGVPGDGDYDCHDNAATAFPRNPAGETAGNGFDDDCDEQVACYVDADADDWGTAELINITYNDDPTTAAVGWDGALLQFDCDLVTGMAAAQGSVASPVFDCHDNYAGANPGISAEVPGHTATQATATPGLCGGGLTACFDTAFDDDCDGVVECYVDEDGDGVGGALTTTEAGILVGSTLPWNVAGLPAPGPDARFTCNVGSVGGTDVSRRSAIGGGPGQPGHDCNDRNSDVRPALGAVAAGSEVAGSSVNPSDPSDAGAYDENCDGQVTCYEDRDQDFYGTRERTTSAALLRDVTVSGSNDKKYDCERKPDLSRTEYASVGGVRDGAGNAPDGYDCHDDNPLANPGVSTEVFGSEAEPLNGGLAAFDDNCDGSFGCFRDRDDDGVGTTTVIVQRTAVVGGRQQLPNGSQYDDGVFTCELDSADVDWGINGGAASPLTGRGGAEGSEDWDCHDTNALAGPDKLAVEDTPGNATDSLGNTDRAYDEDCNGVVECYKNIDGDAYGTYTVAFAVGTDITKVPGSDHFDCDDPVRQVAGRGGLGTANFDCHDDSVTARPSNVNAFYGVDPSVVESPRDAFDNNCDGLISCFEDLDNDGYGTAEKTFTPANFTIVPSSSYVSNPARTAAQEGLQLFLCGEEAALAAGVDAQALPSFLGTDLRASVGGVRDVDGNPGEGFDCHDNNAAAHPGLTEVNGSALDADLGEVVAYDEDCSGTFTCFRDRDDDGYGTTPVAVPRTAFNGGQPLRKPGASIYDDGVYACELAPPGAVATLGLSIDQYWDIDNDLQNDGETNLSGVGGAGSVNFDCHDTNAQAFPGNPVGELPGNSVDLPPPAWDSQTRVSSDDKSWDDDCDGVVDCYRDYDRDTFGTYLVQLERGVVSADGGASLIPGVDGTIATALNSDWFRCDLASENWAGRGEADLDEFDCHDDNADVRPNLTPIDEVDGDAYDNDCDGLVRCFEDLDNDEFGTVLKNVSTVGAVGPDSPIYNPLFDGADSAAAGLRLFPCGPDGAQAAGLDPTTLTATLSADRRSERGGVDGDGNPTADYDCHDNWSGANPGEFYEVPGDPFDNDCNGIIACFLDNDGDGFGFDQTFSLSTTAFDPSTGSFSFDNFPFTTASGDLTTTVLPAWPTQAFPDIAAYLIDPVEQAARAGADSDVWYDCRGVTPPGSDGKGAPAGGAGSPFLDCHDDEPAAFPGFRFVGGTVSLLRPDNRGAASGPFDPSCDGPIMCVVNSGAGAYSVYDRSVDRADTPLLDECTTGDASVGRAPGGWVCFEPQGAPLVGGRLSDRGEIAGDDLDNDCDGTVLCYQDFDQDDVGTAPVLDDGTRTPSLLNLGDRFSCREPSEAEFTGDCHDHTAAVRPDVNLTTATPGDDVSVEPYTSIDDAGGRVTPADGFDDASCDGVVLCHSAVPNNERVYDRYVLGSSGRDCLTDIPLGEFLCYPETPGNDLDEDCDGVIACFYDGDQDAFGDDQYKLAETSVRTRQETLPGSGIFTLDGGTYTCADPSNQIAAVDGDCNDVNAFESPAGIEVSNLLAGDAGRPILVGDRERARQAVGNAIDEDCDGNLACWVDEDDDGYGAGVIPAGTDLSSITQLDVEATWDGSGILAWEVEEVAKPADGSNACVALEGYASELGDCHDDLATANPDGIALAGNDYDDDCDGVWHCYEDQDGDRFGSVNVVVDDGDRTCTTASGEADDALDCLDRNIVTANFSYPEGQRYPVGPFGADLSIPFELQPTVAFLSHPASPLEGIAAGVEIYGDGFDGDCDTRESCFIDNDGDTFIDGRKGLREADALGRAGAIIEVPDPIAGAYDGLITCRGSYALGDEVVDAYPWPLGGVVPTGDNPYANTSQDDVSIFDCDDANAQINPAAPNDIPYNGIDENCDNRSDFDRDRDGYDDAAATAASDLRSPCPADPSNRFGINVDALAFVNPVIGCGVGTDCNDQDRQVHPAPFATYKEDIALAVPQDERFGFGDPDNDPVVDRYPAFEEDPQSANRGIPGDPESCITPFDDDCSGSYIADDEIFDPRGVNTTRACYFDVWGWGDALVTHKALQEGKQLPWGNLSREWFTSCRGDEDAFGSYFIDRSDALDFTAAQLEDPAVLAAAEIQYDDFEFDADWDLPAGVNRPVTRYYPDADGDGEGDANRQGAVLCSLAGEEAFAPGYWVGVGARTDCNDSNSGINGLAADICDRLDNNCNGQADEASALLHRDADLDPRYFDTTNKCQNHYLDSDADNWGVEESIAKTITGEFPGLYCLCPTFEALELVGIGIFQDVTPPSVCEHYTESGELSYGHRLGPNGVSDKAGVSGGICYVMNDRDCDDAQPAVHPRAPGDLVVEIIDGIDNDCDGALPVIELDCDNDGAYPFLPDMTDIYDNPKSKSIGNTEADSDGDGSPDRVIETVAEKLGLAPCAGNAPELVCLGATPTPRCDTVTRLWTVRTSDLPEEYFQGAARTLRPDVGCGGYWDCDDTCPERCEDKIEVCNGIDNNCDGYYEATVLGQDNGLVAVDDDGLPDAVQLDKPHLGRVFEGELDLDYDNQVGCSLGSTILELEKSITNVGCDPGEVEGDDCNDLCYLTKVGAPGDACNGFSQPDTCEVGTGEVDADGDRYQECGNSGPDFSAPEPIYTLLFTKGDTAEYIENPDLNKLAKVVPLIPPRRYDSAAFEQAVDAATGEPMFGRTRECDRELERQIEGVVGELPEGAEERRHALLDVCVLADTCRELAEQLAAGAGGRVVNERDDDAEGRDSTAPAPLQAAPAGGVDQLPPYCAELMDARCSVVEVTLRADKDEDIYAEADAWRQALKSTDADFEERNANACVLDTTFSETFHPEQAVARTVWSRQQIVESRKLVVEYECYRMFGTYGCSDDFSHELPNGALWESPYRGRRTFSQGFFPRPDVPIGVVGDHPEWWIYLNRFSLTNLPGSGAMVDCWGDPRSGALGIDDASTIELVGGDCKATQGDKERFLPVDANRGMAEGPGDMLAAYLGQPVDCSTCLDQVDNNCNSLTDADEPACAQCFVGQGYGCGCAASPSSSRLGGVAQSGMALLALIGAWRRRSSPRTGDGRTSPRKAS
jgi:hypothetical protein